MHQLTYCVELWYNIINRQIIAFFVRYKLCVTRVDLYLL